MKIVLIKPYWKIVRHAICPPLGLMSIAAYLREKIRPTPDVRILDQAAAQMSLGQVEKFLLSERPDIVGISALTYESPAVKLLAELSKRLFPDTPVIVGGPHATVLYDRLLADSLADVAVLGEGEETAREFVQCILDKSDWNKIPGIAYRANGTIVKNPDRSPIVNLDDIPAPAYDLIDVPRYSTHLDMHGFLKARPYMSIFTSRACPFGCIYCHRIFGKKFRAVSAGTTVALIKKLVSDYGIRELHIVDDIFNWDIERAKEICRGIIGEGIEVNIAFPNGIRGDRLDEELIGLLKQAGCYSMTFAVETVSPRFQKQLHKYVDLSKLEWAIESAYRQGIITMAFFMLGFPGETVEEMENTIEWACRSKILRAFFMSVVPFPRTELFELFRTTYPNDFDLDEKDIGRMHYYTSESFYKKVTGIDLDAVVRSAYRRFYLDPKRIADILRYFPWNRTLLRGVYLGFKASWRVGDRFDAAVSTIKRRRAGMNAAAGS